MGPTVFNVESYNNDDASEEDDEFDYLLNEDDDELTAIRNACIAQLTVRVSPGNTSTGFS